MNSTKGSLNDSLAGELRWQAEAMLEDSEVFFDDDSLSPAEVIRELRLQRIELELQNEELQRQNADIDDRFEKFRDLYCHAPVGYLTLTFDGTVNDSNYRAAELLGVSRSTLEGSSLGAHVHPSHQQTLRRHLEEVASGTGVHQCRLSVELPTGTSVYLKMWSVGIDDAQTGDLHCRSALVDVTAERDTEREKDELELQLRESHRMETLGRLASGIAHDFNNLLTLIIGYSKLAMNQLDDDMSVARHAREINKAGHHAAELIDQLLAFTRSDSSTPSAVDVNSLIRDMETMFDRLLGDDIDLQVRLQDPLGKVHFDASQFQQVLMNLVVNAREAMQGGGNLVIRARNTSVDAARAQELKIDEGPYILIEVEDDGDGIPPEVIPHIFEPFFTTKSTDRNHGFGLSTTYGIVSQHEGIIDVRSTPGQGTTFAIYLHRADGEDAPAQERLPTVLVVDDQPDLRDFASLVLEELDVEVISARGPEEALQLSRACGDELDLLVTDVTMPGMSGPELLKRIREHHAQARVLYMSGHDRTNLYSSRGISPDDPFLEKPFSPENLSEMVHSLLFD
jgi:two-component system, cell cycle sensor histidine kinase and response regulator CckA